MLTGGPWGSPWSIPPDSWTGGGLGQALSPALAPLLPGEETHALRVGVDGGEELPGALQLQVREVLPMPRGGQQAFQRFQGCAAGGQGVTGPGLPLRRGPAALGGKESFLQRLHHFTPPPMGAVF